MSRLPLGPGLTLLLMDTQYGPPPWPKPGHDTSDDLAPVPGEKVASDCETTDLPGFLTAAGYSWWTTTRSAATANTPGISPKTHLFPIPGTFNFVPLPVQGR